MAKEKTKIDAARLDDEEGYFSSHVDSYAVQILKRFVKHKMAVVSACVLLLFIICAIFAPYICPYPFDEMHFEDIKGGQPVAPNGKYWFGTDSMGRDLFTRTIYGGRVSLIVGFSAVMVSMCIGIPLGCIAGYYGGMADWIISRTIDVLTCIPTFFLNLLMASILGKSIINVILVIGLFGWMGTTRQVRAQFLSLRRQDFVQAAQALGLKERVVIFRHILPNALVPVIVGATMGVAGAIKSESGLSYLGLGVTEPVPSWGSMLNQSRNYLLKAPWMGIIPGLCICIVSLSLNFVGDGLRDAFDPRMNRS